MYHNYYNAFCNFLDINKYSVPSISSNTPISFFQTQNLQPVPQVPEKFTASFAANLPSGDESEDMSIRFSPTHPTPRSFPVLCTGEIYQLLQHVSGLNSNQLKFLKIQRNTRLMVYTIPIPLVGPQTNSLSNVVQISPYKTFYLLLVPAVTNQLPSQLTAQVHRKCRSAHQSRNSTFFLWGSFIFYFPFLIFLSLFEN